MKPVNRYVRWCLAALLSLGLAGCAKHRTPVGGDRFNAARELFDQTTRLYHLPSARAQEAAKDRLLEQAAAGYQDLLRLYPDQPAWCAQALRSLANIRTEQGRPDEAIALYGSVAERYPALDWDTLQAWKSAADLLWDAGRRDDAEAFYQRITLRFDHVKEVPQVVKTIVQASKRRLVSVAGTGKEERFGEGGL